MNKTFRLLAIGSVLVGIAALTHYGVEARLTGTNPTGSSADAFCVGKSGSEACVDASGNVIPTTTAASSLGTSSLLWTTVNAKSIVPSDTTSSRLHVPAAVAITTTSMLTITTTAGDMYLTYGSGLVANVPSYLCISTGGVNSLVFSSNTIVACRQSI